MESNKELFGYYAYIAEEMGFDIKEQALTDFVSMIELTADMRDLSKDEKELLETLKEELNIAETGWGKVKMGAFKALDWTERTARKGKVALTSEEFVEDYAKLRSALDEKKAQEKAEKQAKKNSSKSDDKKKEDNASDNTNDSKDNKESTSSNDTKESTTKKEDDKKHNGPTVTTDDDEVIEAELITK